MAACCWLKPSVYLASGMSGLNTVLCQAMSRRSVARAPYSSPNSSLNLCHHMHDALAATTNHRKVQQKLLDKQVFTDSRLHTMCNNLAEGIASHSQLDMMRRKGS